MMTKNDWADALDAWVVAERERLGGPPTPEEVVAYLQGDLNDADADRVRALLVYYPELTPLLGEESKIEDEPHVRGDSLRRYMPFAAALLLPLLAIVMLWWPVQPSVEEVYEVAVRRPRGGPSTTTPYELPAGKTKWVIVPKLADWPEYGEYRIDLVDLRTMESRIVWTMRARPSFAITIPRRAVSSGLHRIDVYGIDARGPHALDRIPIMVPR